MPAALCPIRLRAGWATRRPRALRFRALRNERCKRRATAPNQESTRDGSIDIDALALTKFGVGQPVPRNEDPVLLRGEGRYTDDLNLPGQLYGVMVRSRMAHGELRSIDADGAREMPGVHRIVTAADLDAAGIN